MDAEIFISYTQADREAAERLCSSLETRGISCWIAPRNVPAGSEWATAIMQAIGGAKALVLILSSNSKSSRQLAREVENADEKGLKILTFRIEDVAPPENLGYYMGNIQWIDAFGDRFDQGVGRVVEAIRSGPSAVPVRAQTPSPAKPFWKKPSIVGLAALAILIVAGAGISLSRRPPAQTTDSGNETVKASPPARRLLQKALTEWNDGNKTGAMSDVAAAISESPDWPAPYLFKAKWEEANGDQKSALKDVTACIDRKPETANLLSAYKERVKLRQALGDAQGAQADRDEIRKLQNQNR